MSIDSVMPPNHLILCHPLLLSSIFPSIRVSSSESALHIRWPKYWSFSFSISPYNEYSRLISFRIDQFDLLAVQGTLKNFLQHHSSKASILFCSTFFMVQLSHPYNTTRKTIALTIQTFVSKNLCITGSIQNKLMLFKGQLYTHTLYICIYTYISFHKYYCCSVAQSRPTFVTQWTAACQASLSFTISGSNESVMPSNHLILGHPLLLLPSIFPNTRVFSNESAFCTRWPKYWSFCFSIHPSNKYSAFISFRMDWFDFLAVQGTLKSLQHHSSKASILQCSVFLMVQLSHPSTTTGKTIPLTRWTFVSKVMSLLFNMLPRLIIAFLSGSIFNFMAAVTICSDFGAQENEICPCFHCFPIYLP